MMTKNGFQKKKKKIFLMTKYDKWLCKLQKSLFKFIELHSPKLYFSYDP